LSPHDNTLKTVSAEISLVTNLRIIQPSKFSESVERQAQKRGFYMLNTKAIATFFALQALVTLTPAAFAGSNNSPLAGVVLASGSISTANGGRVEAQSRLLTDGTQLSVLTQYNKKGIVTKRTVWSEAKKSSKPAPDELAITAAQTQLAANR